MCGKQNTSHLCMGCWSLAAPGHKNCVGPSTGQDVRPDFPSTCFSQLWRDWEGTGELLEDRYSLWASFFALCCLVPRTQRNQAHTEEGGEQAWKGGAGEEPAGRKVMLQGTGRNRCERSVEGGQGRLLGWTGLPPHPKLTPGLLNVNVKLLLANASDKRIYQYSAMSQCS